MSLLTFSPVASSEIDQLNAELATMRDEVCKKAVPAVRSGRAAAQKKRAEVLERGGLLRMFDPIVDGFQVNGQLRATFGSGKGSQLFGTEYDPRLLPGYTFFGAGARAANRAQARVAERRKSREQAAQARRSAINAAERARFQASAAYRIAQEVVARREAREKAREDRLLALRKSNEDFDSFIKKFFRDVRTRNRQ